jgi:hypothetical protein
LEASARDWHGEHRELIIGMRSGRLAHSDAVIELREHQPRD